MRMTGDLEMHLLFITIANIHSSVCMKATWACIGYIPALEFLTHSDFHSVLEACLWHHCLDIICSGLKVAASIGMFMIDPNNCTHYAFMPLAAVIQSVDLGRSNNPNTTPTKDYKIVRVVVYLRGVQRGYAEEGERGSTPTG